MRMIAWWQHAMSRLITLIELNSDGDCSLREAIQAANTDTMVDACMAGSGVDIICVPEGIYTLTMGPLLVSSDIQLLGAGSDPAIIQAADDPNIAELRVCTIAGPVTISDITIRYGNGVDEGGGIFISDSGSLILTDSVITQNTASVDGGGLRNSTGSLTLIKTKVIDNTATSNNLSPN